MSMALIMISGRSIGIRMMSSMLFPCIIGGRIRRGGREVLVRNDEGEFRVAEGVAGNWCCFSPVMRKRLVYSITIVIVIRH